MWTPRMVKVRWIIGRRSKMYSRDCMIYRSGRFSIINLYHEVRKIQFGKRTLYTGHSLQFISLVNSGIFCTRSDRKQASTPNSVLCNIRVHRCPSCMQLASLLQIVPAYCFHSFRISQLHSPINTSPRPVIVDIPLCNWTLPTPSTSINPRGRFLEPICKKHRMSQCREELPPFQN